LQQVGGEPAQALKQRKGERAVQTIMSDWEGREKMPFIPDRRYQIPNWTVLSFPVRRPVCEKYVYPRYAGSLVRTALRDTRVVAISGPRQSGKTTLARRFAKQGRIYLTLDNQPTLAAAKADPVAFVRGLDRVVIDEV